MATCNLKLCVLAGSAGAPGLSAQQQHIMELIVAGCSNKEISKELAISERTVKYQLTRLFGLFGVSGRMELSRFSLKESHRLH